MTFDRIRLGSALAMLKKFQDENGWQVIVLTKEESLVGEIRKFFPAQSVREQRLAV
jgi:uncharacterized protein YhaN